MRQRSVMEKQTRIVFGILALPALVHIGFMLFTIGSRFFYPYDLEWMEGGLLTHASRIAAGQGIYGPPSIEFVPFPYPPVYPTLVAGLGSVIGISYAVGRSISIASVLGVAAMIVWVLLRQTKCENRIWPWSGAVIGLGLISATYPWVEGWYDLVRGDMLLVFLIVSGFTVLWAATNHRNSRSQLKIAIAAVLLATACFTKQTGVFYVAAGTAILAVRDWRGLPIYLGVVGVLGAGGTWLINSASDGWFWTYTVEVLRTHAVDKERVLAAFGHMLGHFPIMTAAIAIAATTSALIYQRRHECSESTKPFLLWLAAFAVSMCVGAMGWGKQWAHFNVYIPAMITGAMAAALSLSVIHQDLSTLRIRPLVSFGLPSLLVVAFAAQFVFVLWSPSSFIPTEQDRRAGDKLVQTLRTIDGDVYMPFHPWYPHLAGKPTFAHRMGMLDLAYAGKWPISDLKQSLERARFGAVVLDNRPLSVASRGLKQGYRRHPFPANASPHVYTGAGRKHQKSGPLLFPNQLWIPAKETPHPSTGDQP